MIHCKDIVKSFPGQNVIEGFSFDFEEVGFYLLLGESGSGKTTFLNILAGVLPFESGTVEIDGVIWENRVDAEQYGKVIEYITQDSFFVDFLTVEENLLLIGNPESVGDVLAWVGLQDKRQQMPATLSGGEKQRLALARALLGGKRILLLDEPTASLDEASREAVWELLQSMAKEKLIICSTHDRSALTHSEQVIRFSKKKTAGKGAKTTCAVTKKKKTKRKQPVVRKKGAPFLEKYFTRSKRFRPASVWFSVFLVFAICLCLLPDSPQNKMECSMKYLFGINSFTVTTFGNTAWNDICPKDFCGYAVMSYELSTPWEPDVSAGNSSEFVIPFDILKVLPRQAEYFALSDRIICGTYYTGDNQVILSWEMAESISPHNPEALLGSRIQKNVYGLGTTDYCVVGIFDRFDTAEREYLGSIGISVAGNEDNPGDVNTDLCFFGSDLTERLERDPSCCNGSSGQRGYTLFFSSFDEMKKAHQQLSNAFLDSDTVRIRPIYTNTYLEELFHAMFRICMPLALGMSVFSALFYIELKKIEFMHTSRFVSVYEYSGYDKKAVLRRFIWLNIRSLSLRLAVSAAIALTVSWIVNRLNRICSFCAFQIFSYSLWLDLAFCGVIFILFWGFTNIFFRRIRGLSWYENLIAERDLL